MSDSQKVFTDIYKNNVWNNGESISGYGSTHQQTRFLKIELPYVLDELNVKSMLDLPCGDFNWMQEVDLTRVDYIGADVVEELTLRNREKFEAPKRHFETLDLARDPLPKVDAIFCRDCLVHLPNDTIFEALKNICLSGSTYLLTTSYSWRFMNANDDIQMGHWRRVNLELSPFNLPPPMRILIEGCTEADGQLGDKTISVWPISQIKRRLQDRFPELKLKERANTLTGLWKTAPLIDDL